MYCGLVISIHYMFKYEAFFLLDSQCAHCKRSAGLLKKYYSGRYFCTEAKSLTEIALQVVFGSNYV